MTTKKMIKLASGEQPVLLAVLAHPDDETFGMGGTLAKYAHSGVDVFLVCATRGEVGEMEERFLKGYTTKAERREAELRCAAAKLGIKEVFLFDYRDSGMPGSEHNHHPKSLVSASDEEVAEKIAHYIRLLKPHVLLTFDPIGGYRHPDHIKIHEATNLALSLAGDAERFKDPDDLAAYKPKKMYYHLIPRTFLRVTVKLMRLVGRDPKKFGANQDIDLDAIANVDFPVNAVINFRPVARLRNEASACHASQGGSKIGGGILGWLRRFFGSKDQFMRAYPQPVAGEKKEEDLFAGL